MHPIENECNVNTILRVIYNRWFLQNEHIITDMLFEDEYDFWCYTKNQQVLVCDMFAPESKQDKKDFMEMLMDNYFIIYQNDVDFNYDYYIVYSFVLDNNILKLLDNYRFGLMNTLLNYEGNDPVYIEMVKLFNHNDNTYIISQNLVVPYIDVIYGTKYGHLVVNKKRESDSKKYVEIANKINTSLLRIKSLKSVLSERRSVMVDKTYLELYDLTTKYCNEV